MKHAESTAAILHRPVRGAWLINEAELSGTLGMRGFSDFAEACCRWWEGRNSLLVRFSEEGLSDDSRRILEHHDPDEIIVLGDPPLRIIETVDEIVRPMAFRKERHVKDQISHGDFQLHTIASLPTPRNFNRRDESLFDRDPPHLLLFAFHDECPAEVRQCVALNFGAYAHVVWQDGRIDFGLADRLWKDLPCRVYLLGTVEDFAAALDEIAGDWERAGLRFIAPMGLAEGRDDVKHRWPDDHRYHVYVGDSVEDAELFWQQPIADGSWTRCSGFRFYLPAFLATHPSLRIPLQKWLRRCTGAGSSNHDPPLFISKSLIQPAVQEIADFLLSDNQFAIHPACGEQRTSLDFARAEVRLPASIAEVERSHLVEIVRWNSPSNAVLVGRPEILIGNEQGARWMADMWLEMPQDEFAPDQHSVWRLPRSRSEALVDRMFRGGSRLTRAGYPSVTLEGSRPKIVFAQPPPLACFTMLFRGEQSSRFANDVRRELPAPPSAILSVAVSEKGQRYRGTLDVFGGLPIAARYFESGLWRTIFRELASEKASADASLDQELTFTLRKAIPTATAVQLKTAVRRIMGKIQGRTKETRLTLRQLMDLLEKVCGGKRPFPIEQRIGEDAIQHDDSECPHNETTLRHNLSDLLARGVVEAGFEFACWRCGTVSWLRMGDARQNGECPDCRTVWHAKAEMPWCYRLAPLAKRALQSSGGAMPVILAVHGLGLESRGSFLWHPNLEILRPDYENGKRPWHELDIVCLLDGKFVVGEVKNNISEFVASDFESLRAVCELIQPNLALLVFLEGEFGEATTFAKRVTELKSQVAMKTRVEWRKIPTGW